MRSSPESVGLDRKRLRSLDLTVAALGKLRIDKQVNVLSLWQRREVLFPSAVAYSLEETRQAFQDLANRGLAQSIGSDNYRIIPRGAETLPSDLLHDELKTYSEDIRTKAKIYTRWMRLTQIFFWSMVAPFILVIILRAIPSTGVGSFAWYSTVPGLVWESITSLLLFLALICSFMSDRRRIPRELLTSLSFQDAYDAYSNVIRGKDGGGSLKRARAILLGIAERLETKVRDRPVWATLSQEREKISQIGEETRTRPVPAMDESKSQSGVEHVGDVLVRLARYFSEPSSDSMSNALQLIPPLRDRRVSVPRGLSVQLRMALANFWAAYALIVILVLAGYLFFWQTMGWKILGEPTQYLALAGIFVAAIPAGNIIASKMVRA